MFLEEKKTKVAKSKNVNFDTNIENRTIFKYDVVSINAFSYSLILFVCNVYCKKTQKYRKLVCARECILGPGSEAGPWTQAGRGTRLGGAGPAWAAPPSRLPRPARVQGCASEPGLNVEYFRMVPI